MQQRIFIFNSFLIIFFAKLSSAADNLHIFEVNDCSVLHEKYLELQMAYAQLQLNISQLSFETKHLRLVNFKLRKILDHVPAEYKNFNANTNTAAATVTTTSTTTEASVPNAILKNCATLKSGGSGIYDVATPPFRVACDGETQNGGWTVIQRRMDGSVSFYRPWSDYVEGFGDLEGEFFAGLENLHLLTTYEPQELLILMEDFDNVTKYAKYDRFEIASADKQYTLILGAYAGDAGDTLKYHNVQKFSTYDSDNDKDSDNCAQRRKGGWWYKNCEYGNLNGLYLSGKFRGRDYAGTSWHHFHNTDWYSLKFVQMMIRPRT